MVTNSNYYDNITMRIVKKKKVKKNGIVCNINSYCRMRGEMAKMRNRRKKNKSRLGEKELSGSLSLFENLFNYLFIATYK